MVSRWSPKPEAGVRFSSPLPNIGSVAEWSIATVLKTVERESVPWVRIPPLPPL
jgi:hypothetical protein